MGTVVSCPECGHANDLAVPLPRRMGVLTPFLWGMAPVGLWVIHLVRDALVGTRSAPDTRSALVACLLVGAVITGVLRYKMFRHEPEMGREPRPLGVKAALSAGAGVVFVAGNVMILLVVVLAFALITGR